jgi:hypothetical protein
MHADGHAGFNELHRDMICAETAAGVETRRRAFLRKWRLTRIRHGRSDQWRDTAHRRRQPRG